MSTDEESSDEDFGLLKQALPVGAPKKFDPTSKPVTGEEYIQQVIYERSRIRKCVTADINTNKFLKNQSRLVPKEQSNNLPHNRCPSKEWCELKNKQFAEFTEFISAKAKPESLVYQIDPSVDILKKVLNTPPNFHEVSQYSQSLKSSILDIISKYLDTGDPVWLKENCGAWIFALLALLEKPLSPDTCHSLREFSKKCAEVRTKLRDDVENDVYVPLNLFIAIIGNYFHQLDLAD